MADLAVNLLHIDLMRKALNLLASMAGDKGVPKRYKEQIAALIRYNDRQEVNGNIAMEIKQ